jgi:hypothetical protein
MKRPSALVAAAFVAVAVLLFIPSAGAASIVQLQSPAYLRNHGAVADVTVMVVCKLRRTETVGAASTPARATLTVNLTERVGKHIASGSGKVASRNGDFRCDGGSHLVHVFVPAKSTAFAKGGAFGQAVLKVCTTTCRSVTDSRTVRLT